MVVSNSSVLFLFLCVEMRMQVQCWGKGPSCSRMMKVGRDLFVELHFLHCFISSANRIHIIYSVSFTRSKVRMICFKVGVANDYARYAIARARAETKVSPSRCCYNRGASCKNNHIVHLDEDRALSLSGSWLDSRALGRVKDTEVDEPGTWDALVRLDFKDVLLYSIIEDDAPELNSE